MAEPQKFKLRHYSRCLLACTLVSMSPFQYGIDFGLIGGMQAMVGFLQVFGYRDPNSPIGYNITPEVQQLISSLMTIGAFVGSLIAGPMSLYLGRKGCLWTASLLCAVSNGIMMGTTNLGGIYAGRLLIGIANGLFMTFGQLYLQEVAPAKYRGMAIAAFNFWTSTGTLIGTIVDNFTSKIEGRNCYLIPLALIYIVPTIISIGLIFIPESPRYLVSKDKIDQARKALTWLRPNGDLGVEAELREIELIAQEEKEQAKSVGWWDCFKDPVDRRRTMIAVGAVTVQAASGAFFMIAYGTYFFEMAGVGNPFENSCILTAIGVVAIIVCILFIAPHGSRRLFLTLGLVICGCCQLIVAVVYTKYPGTETTGKVIVGLSVLYIAGYNGMIASFAWLVGGEVPSQRLRSYTFGLAAAVGFLGAWLAAFTAPYFINPSALNWGPQYGYIWFPSCLLAAVFVWIYVPETKNRSLEELSEMFEAHVPARKFKTYQCSVARIARDKEEVDPTVRSASLEKPLADSLVETIENVTAHHTKA